MSDDGGAVCCFLMMLVLFIGAPMYFFSGGDAKAHAEFLVNSTAMETLAVTLGGSNIIRQHLTPGTGPLSMVHDIHENFKGASCTPAKPPYSQCSFTTAIKGPGSQASMSPMKMEAGSTHTFKHPFTWAQVHATVDVHKNCHNCNEMAISHLEVELHENSLWQERLGSLGKSAAATVAANAGSFLMVELINGIFGLEGKSRIEHEISVVVVDSYEFIRVSYIVVQDHDGDGDITATDAHGWNHLAKEWAVLVKGNNVMGIFQSSGDMGLGHHAAAFAAAEAGMFAAKKMNEVIDGDVCIGGDCGPKGVPALNNGNKAAENSAVPKKVDL